jgi:hypothetical protein
MYHQALKQFRLQPQQAVMIGDQLFTDILGANRAGIEAIWVKPMSSRDFIGTKVSRFGERMLRPMLFRSMQTEAMEEVEGLPPGGAGQECRFGVTIVVTSSMTWLPITSAATAARRPQPPPATAPMSHSGQLPPFWRAARRVRWWRAKRPKRRQSGHGSP